MHQTPMYVETVASQGLDPLHGFDHEHYSHQRTFDRMATDLGYQESSRGTRRRGIDPEPDQAETTVLQPAQYDVPEQEGLIQFDIPVKDIPAKARTPRGRLTRKSFDSRGKRQR